MNENLVSVIIPIYNAEKYLKQSIDSVLAQTYSNIELILIDDGSTDLSLQITKQYEADNVHIISQENQGGCVARNKGIQAAKGKYIKFLDADDLLYPNAIEEQVKQIEDCKENEIVFGDFDFIDENNKVSFEYKFDKNYFLNKDPESFFVTDWVILITCPLHKKEILLKLGGFDENLKSGQESDLHFRLALMGIKFIHYPTNIFAYRSHRDEQRISVKRIKNVPDIEQIKYRFNKHITLLKEKNGNLNLYQKKFYEQAFFGLFRKYLIDNKIQEGKYCLKKSKELAPYSIPAFKEKRILGFVYILSGSIIGFRNLEMLLSKKKKKTKSNDLLSKVLNE